MINNIVDTAVSNDHSGTILMGSNVGAYGKNLPDAYKNISVSNVISNAVQSAVDIKATLTDSSITGVISKRAGSENILVRQTGGLNNVCMENIVSAAK